jgi:hypothetical protein
MMISRVIGMAICLCAGFLSLVLSKDTTVQCGKCRITVLGTYFWRDWMPIVRSPGPDGGSPLHARVKVSLDNSAGDANKFTFRTAIVDDKGQSYPVAFHVFSNSRNLSDNNAKSHRTYSIETEKAPVTGEYNMIWDGGLNPGEIREIELTTAEGPYLAAGSRVHLRIEWTDQKGDTAALSTPDEFIERTD